MSGVFTLPPDRCFVTTLAEGLWQRVDGDPLALAEITLFLPTRRACRHLREAFLRTTGAQAALLPRLKPLGDVDEDAWDFGDDAWMDELPPALPPLQRQLQLIRLIRRKDSSLPYEQASSLAASLAALLDQAYTEGKDLHDLEGLVPENYAEHWQKTLAFLEIILAHWPAFLQEQGCLDAVQRRTLVLEKQADAWTTNPPSGPVIAAGSTGSHPAVGRLMAVIASLPQGEVILPGLDTTLDEASWQAIEETHPQVTMKAWLEKNGIPRTQVRFWNETPAPSSPRLRLLQETMRPAAATEAWRELNHENMPPDATKGLEVLPLEHHREEADVIALRLRAVLEEEGQTAALVTPDRALAARVAAALGRWGLAVNDSAGSPLDQWPIGHFLCDVLHAAQPEASPLFYLSLLKHPLASASVDPATCRTLARQAEIDLWRGVRRSHGWQGAAQAAEEKTPDLSAWLKELAALFAPFTNAWEETAPLTTWIDRHITLSQHLAQTPQEKGADRLWRGEAGETAVLWLDDLRQAGDADAHRFPLRGKDYAALFLSLIRQVPVRPRYGTHPRLHLLGPLEARLLHHDLVILGGVNEDTWPPAAPLDPWLSRPMKKAFGLPSPERRIGLSAHDFAQFAAQPQVLITRAKRVGGVPTVPSRFLLQMEAVLQAADYTPQEALTPQTPWRIWAAALDQPDRVAPMSPPRPCPPAEARPQSLSVTEIGTWLRNPYAIYARRILELSKLEDIDADVAAADLGNVIHRALESFVRATLSAWPQDPLALLLQEGRKAFALFADRPQMQAFWWPRFEQLAAWFVDHEERRRAEGYTPLAVEAEALMTLADGAFTLKGRADRVDRTPDGGLALVDYKTGAPPNAKDVLAGVEPQLPLLALLAAVGGFTEGKETSVSEIAYWALGERDEGDRIKNIKGDIEALSHKAREGLESLIAAFADPATPYEAEPKPRLAPRYNDYAHLARLAEWGRFKEGGRS